MTLIKSWLFVFLLSAFTVCAGAISHVYGQSNDLRSSIYPNRYSRDLEAYLNANLGAQSRVKIDVVSRNGIPRATLFLKSLPPDMSCGKSAELLEKELSTKIEREGWEQSIIDFPLPIIKISPRAWRTIEYQVLGRVLQQITALNTPLFYAIGSKLLARLDELWNSQQTPNGLLVHVYRNDFSPALFFHCGEGRVLMIDVYFYTTYLADQTPASLDEAQIRAQKVLGDFVVHGNVWSACRQDPDAFCLSFSTPVPLGNSENVDPKQVEQVAEAIFQRIGEELIRFMLTPRSFMDF